MSDLKTLDDAGVDYSREAKIDPSDPKMLWIPLLGLDGVPATYVIRHRILDCSTSELAELFKTAFNAEVEGEQL